jgi:hypothetical protein
MAEAEAEAEADAKAEATLLTQNRITTLEQEVVLLQQVI